MMHKDIKAGLKSGKLKELTLTQAERYSPNEQFLQLMREGRLNIKAYWHKEQRKVVFGIM
jgi:ribonuclease PH